MAAIVAVSEWLHWPLLMEAALAAWLTCLCDAGGPIRRRVPYLLTFGFAGAALTAGYGLLGALASLPAVVALAALGVFCASLLRGGSLWALLLTMVIWRLHPYMPARHAVGDCWRRLALLAGDLREVLRHPAAHETEWDRHAREHRGGVRAAIEVAREAVLATVRSRGPVSERAASRTSARPTPVISKRPVTSPEASRVEVR